MGTRSLTFVHDEDDNVVVCIYQQFDGYFDGVGDNILDFLRGGTVVNGISMGTDKPQFNGAGDLAARLITHFKDGDASIAGGVYVESPTLVDGDMGTEFAYHIRCKVGVEPYVQATAVYSDHTVQGYASEIVWPTQDEDGNYIDAADSPMTDGQRNALFAAFNDAYGDTSEKARHKFTRTVLGRNAPVSWSKEGGISAEQAGRLLDTLKMIEEGI